MDGEESARSTVWEASDADFEAPRLTRIDPTRGDSKLALSPAPGETRVELLTQADRVVGRIVRGDDGTWLESSSGSWAITRPRTWRGWRLDLVRQDAAVGALSYRPSPVRLGGVFLAGGQRYSLHWPVLAAGWRLRDNSGQIIAMIRPRRYTGYDVDLRPAAALDDPLVLLVLASCWLIAREPQGFPSSA
jgi:hypothetical protein